jgi:hypothetical protein
MTDTPTMAIADSAPISHVDGNVRRLPAGHGLLVLSPDAQLDGVVQRLADRLAVARCRITAAVPRQLEPSLVARMYRGNMGLTGDSRMEGSWLGRRLFQTGRSMVLLLHAPSIADLPATLAAWKGPSAHGERGPGALRSVAEFTHKCMSLVHTPEDASQAATDAELLVGAELLDVVLLEPVDRTVSWTDVRRSLTPVRPHAELSPDLFLGRVVAKALVDVMIDARLTAWSPDWRGGSGRVADALWSGQLDHRDLRYGQGITARVTPGSPFAAAELTRLVDRRRHLVDVLRLIGAGDFGGRFAEYAADVLTDNGVLTDPWEKQLLLSVLTFPLTPRNP